MFRKHGRGQDVGPHTPKINLAHAGREHHIGVMPHGGLGRTRLAALLREVRALLEVGSDAYDLVKAVRGVLGHLLAAWHQRCVRPCL